MALAPIDDYEKDRIVRLKPDYRISKTIRYPSQKDLNWSAHINKQPLVDAGIYVLNKQSLQLIDQKIFSTDTFLEKLTKKEMLYGFPTEALYFNVGTPEILYTAEQKWQKERQNLLIPFTSIKQ
jgi:NDP-sugar pyrophosphorylase family protein